MEDPGSALGDQGNKVALFSLKEKGIEKSKKDADGESSVQTRERRSVRWESANSLRDVERSCGIQVPCIPIV